MGVHQAIHCHVLAAAAATILLIQPAAACEFGNVFIGDAAAQSNAASATALHGLKQLFAALEARELGDLEDGGRLLDEAVEALSDASADMAEISFSEESDSEIAWGMLSADHVDVVEAIVSPLPPRISGLFETFAAETGNLANALAQHSGTDSEAILPSIADDLAAYILLGTIVTGVASDQAPRCP